jgi:hypothetical protein
MQRQTGKKETWGNWTPKYSQATKTNVVRPSEEWPGRREMDATWLPGTMNGAVTEAQAESVLHLPITIPPLGPIGG